ncbi:MAG: hypothetical protein M3Y27_18055, partial [Acidobacteriota bacterium]|nr:hypothetical protein [Acidobacteriota bacterium]
DQLQLRSHRLRQSGGFHIEVVTMWLNIAMFVGSLIVVLWASEPLAAGLDRLGSKLHLSDAVLGLLVALGADSPEICSAIVALVSNQRDLGVGIVLGSNLFNLAALLGLGAVVAGQVSANSAGTILHGVVAIAVTLVAGALIADIFDPLTSLIVLLLLVVPYIYILTVGATAVERLPLPNSWKIHLARACNSAKTETSKIGYANQQRQRRKAESGGESTAKSWRPVFWIVPAIGAIVLGSTGLIRGATALGQHWLPHPVLGTFVLAGLTGLPNSFTAIRLARHGKGSAVITETFNSNTINILLGLALPALVVGQGSLNALTLLDLLWLLLLTAVAVVLTAHAGKLTRKQGTLLIALYLVFVGTWIAVFTSGGHSVIGRAGGKYHG